MVRQIINKKQTKNIEYCNFNGQLIAFNKKNGYTFSDNILMDEMINYFLGIDGFELVKGNKPKQPKETKKEAPKQVHIKADKSPESKPKVDKKPFFSKKKDTKEE